MAKKSFIGFGLRGFQIELRQMELIQRLLVIFLSLFELAVSMAAGEMAIEVALKNRREKDQQSNRQEKDEVRVGEQGGESHE